MTDERVVSDTNPPITSLLRRFTKVEFVVLAVAGGSLFFIPDIARLIWPWALTPFNMRFLGAIYLASLVGVAMLLRVGRWEPARLVAPQIFTFTVVVLIVSWMNLGRFGPTSLITVAWFVLYTALPINAAYYVWTSRASGSPGPTPLSGSLRAYLLIQGLITGAYGLGLLIAPGPSSAFWPWTIDDFHGQMYSAAFLTLAVGSLIVWRSASRVEGVTLGAIQFTLGLLSILGLAIVDLSVHRVAWQAAGTVAWSGAFLVILLTGITMIRAAGSSSKDQANARELEL